VKIVLQRVSSAAVTVDGETVGAIGPGLLLLVGFGRGDTEAGIGPMIDKVLNMRIFPDQQGRFHHSVGELSGELLVVPQFTLYADTSKGRRPDFFGALEPKAAEVLYERFLSMLAARYSSGRVAGGRFGAHMQVASVNDGPVTILLDYNEQEST
jgi:D-tyrosyl-tRNA(Tyr) deacylase